MLFGSGGPSKPSVIRNVQKQLRAIGCKTPNFAWIDGFITDKNTEGISAGEMPNNVFVSFVEATYFAGHARDHLMDQRKRIILAERNEMHFVVNEDALA